MSTGLAVVLGGGGSAGVGWELGVLLGLAESGLDVRSADVLVGTSAGAIVAVQVSSGLDVAELYARATKPVDQSPMELDYAAVSAGWFAAAAGASSGQDARARIGRLALDSDTMPPHERRAQIAALLPDRDWPARPIVITAVNASTGALRTFTAKDGVELLDAVGASCAVPCVWPPVEIAGEPFMDGAVHSPTNAALASGHGSVLVIAPLLPELGRGIAGELARLGTDVDAEVISPDAAALAAFGANVLDPRTGPAAAREGLRQARAAAPDVARLFG